MKKALETLRETLPFFRREMAKNEGVAENIRPLLTAAVGLYKKEKEMIRPGVMLILEGENPAIPGYDPLKEAAKEAYGGFSKEGLLAKWAAQRNATIAVLSNLSDDQLERTGITPEGKEITIREFIRQWADEEKRWRSHGEGEGAWRCHGQGAE